MAAMGPDGERKEDNQLEQDLRKYVAQNLKRSEVLDFVKEDFPKYTWSVATLNRCLRFYGIHYINYDTPLAEVSAALEGRNLQRKRKNENGHFSSEGPLWLVSLDGHDKLCQNSTFPLGVYSCIDAFSHKVLFLFLCYSNSNSMITGRMYL